MTKKEDKPKRSRSGIGFDNDLKWHLKEIAAKRHETLEDLINESLWLVVIKELKIKRGKKR